MHQLYRRSRYFIIIFALVFALVIGHGTRSASFGVETAQPSQPSRNDSAQELLESGRSAYQNYQIDQAIAVWQTAAQRFEQAGNSLQQALVLSYLSMAYQSQGQPSPAAETITQSLALLNLNPSTQEQTNAAANSNLSDAALRVRGQVLNTSGTLQFSQGNLTDALAHWQQSGSFYQQANDSQRYTGSLINQAHALQALGYFLQARETLDQVQAQLDQASPELQVLGLQSLGDTLQVIGDLEAAATTYQQALEIAETQSIPREQTALLLSLGRLAQLQQRPDEALALFRQAEAIAPDALQQSQAKVDRFSLLTQTESWSDAERLATILQPQLKALPPSRTSLYLQASFAHRLVRSRALPGAIEQGADLLATTVQQAQSIGDRYAEAYAKGYLGNAYEVTQQWPGAQTLTEEALALAQQLNATDIVYQWQWQLGRLLKAQNKPQEAIAAYKTAFQSLQQLRYDLAAIAPEQQFSFRESVEPVYRDYVGLLLSPEATPDQLQQAREVIESLQIAELNNYFQSACIEGQAVALDQVDQTSAAVIYPIILSDRLEVIVSLPGKPLQRHTAAVSRDQVETTLDELKRNLARPLVSPSGQTLGEEVYSWLVRPVEADLQQNDITTLVFVLDGSLRSVPMAALYDGDRYLIETYSVALTPGLQLIAPQPLQQQGLETIAGGLSAARHGFSALSNVIAEIEKIEETVPSQVLIDESFTSEALQAQVEALPYPVVHLATHGQFSSRPEDTFILTWDRPLNVNEISAILRTGDQTRSAPIELLIMSACETATGDDRAALGLAGVAVRAGARSTIASLWNLDDASGAVLVGNLYEELTNPNISKAEALRQAQLALLNTSDYQAPYFWSAFVLVGNWL